MNLEKQITKIGITVPTNQNTVAISTQAKSNELNSELTLFTCTFSEQFAVIKK